VHINFSSVTAAPPRDSLSLLSTIHYRHFLYKHLPSVGRKTKN